jgi:CDP-ribitol ribitolphosphotransferase
MKNCSINYYEFSLMKKPILFYTYDREIYELTRGVYRKVKENAPGKVCDTFSELLNALSNED